MPIKLPKKVKMVRLPWRRKTQKKFMEFKKLLKEFKAQDKIESFSEFKTLNSNEMGDLGDISSLMSSMFGGMTDSNVLQDV